MEDLYGVGQYCYYTMQALVTLRINSPVSITLVELANSLCPKMIVYIPTVYHSQDLEINF